LVMRCFVEIIDQIKYIRSIGDALYEMVNNVSVI